MSNEVTFANKNATSWDQYLPERQTVIRGLAIASIVAALIAITGLVVSGVMDSTYTKTDSLGNLMPGCKDFVHNVDIPLFTSSMAATAMLGIALVPTSFIFATEFFQRRVRTRALKDAPSFKEAAISSQHTVFRQVIIAVALPIITVAASLLFYSYIIQSSSSFHALQKLQDLSQMESMLKNMEIVGWLGLIGGGGIAILGYLPSKIVEMVRLKLAQREAQAVRETAKVSSEI